MSATRSHSLRATGPSSFYPLGPCRRGRPMATAIGRFSTEWEREKLMHTTTKGPLGGNRGFTLIEMMIAMLMMSVAMLAVAQLVPFSMRLNNANREDSTALVLAQSEMSQFSEQPHANANFVDAAPNACTLADATTPNQCVGSPVVPFHGRQVINFA